MIIIVTLSLASSPFHRPYFLLKTTMTGRHYKSALHWWNGIVQQKRAEKKFIRIYFIPETLQRFCLKLSLVKWKIQTICTVHRFHQVNLHHWHNLVFLSSGFQVFQYSRPRRQEQVKFSRNSQKASLSLTLPVRCRVTHHSGPVGWFSVWRQEVALVGRGQHQLRQSHSDTMKYGARVTSVPHQYGYMLSVCF